MLSAQKDKLMRLSLAEATNKCYESGWNRWRKHRADVLEKNALELSEKELYNPSEEELIDFVADLTLESKGKPKGLAAKTIRVYLSAVTHHHALRGHPDPKEGKLRLAKALTGVKRHAGTARKPKRPITLSLLKELKRHVDDETSTGKALWAAMCMGVHGLFRLGELLPPAKEGRELKVGDLRRVNDRHVTVRLPRSKTDRFGKGALVNLFATGDSTCPLRALEELRRTQEGLALEVTDSAPLFAITKKGKPACLTKPEMVSRLKKAVSALAKEHPDWGLESKDFAGHSLRRGGATSLALRGIAEPVLRLLGRWESDAVNLYIALPVSSLEEASRLMTAETDKFRAADLAAAASQKAGKRWLRDL